MQEARRPRQMRRDGLALDRRSANSLHMTHLAALPRRAVLAIEGEDRIAFLQGLVSNDVAAAEPGHAVWAALLTPQGKWLADFFIFADGERLLLDCERGQAPDAAAAPVALPPAVQGDAAALPTICRSTPRGDGAPDVAGDRCAGPAPAGGRLAPAVRRHRCPPPRSKPTGTAIGWRSGCPMARATWRRKRPCCWRPASTSCTACRGARAATWARS